MDKLQKFKERVKKAREKMDLKDDFKIFTSVMIIGEKEVFELNPFLVDLKKLEYGIEQERNILTGRLKKVNLKKLLSENGIQ